MLERNRDVVTLHDIDPSSLRQLIEYAYTGEIKITEDNVQVNYNNNIIYNNSIYMYVMQYRITNCKELFKNIYYLII